MCVCVCVRKREGVFVLLLSLNELYTIKRGTGVLHNKAVEVLAAECYCPPPPLPLCLRLQLLVCFIRLSGQFRASAILFIGFHAFSLVYFLILQAFPSRVFVSTCLLPTPFLFL